MDDYHFHTQTQEPYEDLLKKNEWLTKKARIIARDHSKCCNCGKTGSEVPLEVHHKFYAEGHDPWEYPDEALVTLCAECHRKWHENNDIRLAEKRGDTWYWVKLVPCTRCHGVGYLHEYDYYMDGICFRCWGERFEESEERIRLFTEEKGKTPQEYFDVFIPLTDKEVVRLYKEEHSDLFVSGVSYLVKAELISSNGHTRVDLVANTGLIYYAFPDVTMLNSLELIENRVYCLNVNTLLFKECMSKNNTKYLVIKGDLISYDEATKMSKEIRSAHQAQMTP